MAQWHPREGGGSEGGREGGREGGEGRGGGGGGGGREGHPRDNSLLCSMPYSMIVVCRIPCGLGMKPSVKASVQVL